MVEDVSERWIAPRFLCAEAGQGLPPFPAPLSSPVASFLRCAPNRFLLTKPNTYRTIELPASPRSDGVRDHPGIPFGFPSERAFSFTGIPNLQQFAYSASHDLQEPLRMVTTYCELLKEEFGGRLGETGEAYLAHAVQGTARMERLLSMEDIDRRQL